MTPERKPPFHTDVIILLLIINYEGFVILLELSGREENISESLREVIVWIFEEEEEALRGK